MIRYKAVVPLYPHTYQCVSSLNPDEFLSLLIEDKLLFILTYFTPYLFQTILGFLLGLSQRQAQIRPNIQRKFCKIKKCLRFP